MPAAKSRASCLPPCSMTISGTGLRCIRSARTGHTSWSQPPRCDGDGDLAARARGRRQASTTPRTFQQSAGPPGEGTPEGFRRASCAVVAHGSPSWMGSRYRTGMSTSCALRERRSGAPGSRGPASVLRASGQAFGVPFAPIGAGSGAAHLVVVRSDADRGRGGFAIRLLAKSRCASSTFSFRSKYRSMAASASNCDASAGTWAAAALTVCPGLDRVADGVLALLEELGVLRGVDRHRVPPGVVSGAL